MKVSILLSTFLMSSVLMGCTAADIQTLTTGGGAESNGMHKLAPTKPESVRLYYQNEKTPKRYTNLGRVSASNDNMMGIPHSQITIDQKLKEEAATLGANAVIHVKTGIEETEGEAVLLY